MLWSEMTNTSKPASAVTGEGKPRSLPGLLGRGKQQLISIGIDNLDHVHTPPGFLARHRPLGDFPPNLRKSLRGQFHEQARLAASRGIFAKDDLASRAIHLADSARSVALMPALLEAEQVDVEPQRAVHVGNKEHGTCVPPMSDLLCDGCLGHAGFLLRPTRRRPASISRPTLLSAVYCPRDYREEPLRFPGSPGLSCPARNNSALRAYKEIEGARKEVLYNPQSDTIPRKEFHDQKT